MPIRGKSKPAPSAKPGGAAASVDSDDSIIGTVRGLAEIVSDHGLSELIVEAGDSTITLRRGVTGTVVTHAPMQHAQHAPVQHVAQHTPAAQAAPAAAPAVAAPDKAHIVTSPFVGTFYRRPNPDSPNYVAKGDKIGKGAVLCIVEAMKLMNEIEADVAGIVLEILVEDGSPVEYGQKLFRIEV